MKVAFRADASLDIGTGHVMRCLTLADALVAQGAICTFVCRAHKGHLADRVVAAGHKIRLLPIATDAKASMATDEYAEWLGCDQKTDAEQTHAALSGQYDWIVVDHYGLDAKWEAALRNNAKRIMVIDDLANQSHDCDLLLDQNLGRQSEDYVGLVPENAECLIGPEYALLRPEFAQWRQYSLNRRQNPELKHILVTLGGVDKDNVTGQVLETMQLAELPSDTNVTVVMGGTAPWLENVRRQAASMKFSCELKVDVENMAELMADSDLAIGAAGSTSWERCCLGLPSITVALAKNQYHIANGLEKMRAAQFIRSLHGAAISKKLSGLLKNSEMAKILSANAAQVTCGDGTIVVSTKMFNGAIK